MTAAGCECCEDLVPGERCVCCEEVRADDEVSGDYERALGLLVDNGMHFAGDAEAMGAVRDLLYSAGRAMALRIKQGKVTDGDRETIAAALRELEAM